MPYWPISSLFSSSWHTASSMYVRTCRWAANRKKERKMREIKKTKSSTNPKESHVSQSIISVLGEWIKIETHSLLAILWSYDPKGWKGWVQDMTYWDLTSCQHCLPVLFSINQELQPLFPAGSFLDTFHPFLSVHGQNYIPGNGWPDPKENSDL